MGLAATQRIYSLVLDSVAILRVDVVVVLHSGYVMNSTRVLTCDPCPSVGLPETFTVTPLKPFSHLWPVTRSHTTCWA